ncbi:MAG: S-layer homology domain-containing protein, partial [Lachnospiraceae bacterium]|nr:S-layer homology domain-containing protein [Lachnospiraceae bacterium]
QMVTFLWRMAGKPKTTLTESPFSDVANTDAYYYEAVLWAYENKIAEGYKDGTFKPQGECLRRQAVMFLWRLAGKPEVVPEYEFADVPQYNKDGSENIWYAPVMWAANEKITTGVAGSDPLIFNEGGKCLRRQMVTFLYRYANPDWDKE